MGTPVQLTLFGEAANDAIYDARRVVRQRRGAKWHSPEWQRTRNLVLERDHYACHFCQRQPHEVRVDVFHLQPDRIAPNLWRSQGNIITLCDDCRKTEEYKQAMHCGWRYIR